MKAIRRDLGGLLSLGAIKGTREEDGYITEISVDLQWPTEITAREFLNRLKNLPAAKGNPFL